MAADRKLEKKVRSLERSFVKRTRKRDRALARFVSPDEVQSISARAVEEFCRMAPEVARLDNTILNGSLAGTYEYLAYSLAMRAHGIDDETIGAFYSASWQVLVERFPKGIGRWIFRLAKPYMRRRLEREALASESAGDGEWRFDFVPPEKGSHDFGIDIRSCAVCALYGKHDASELVPYLCALDDEMSEALDMGLRRKGTKALGASCCDFRYNAGGEPEALSSRQLPVVS